MSAELLFSFLLFFQVQIESIKESGFYKMLLEKYPEMAEEFSDRTSMDPELQEIIDLTGLNFDDLAQFSLTVEGLDNISKASEEGRSPKIGSELDFFLSAKLKGDLDAMKMISFILEKIDEEKGAEFRKKVEETISKSGNSTSLTIPSDLLDQTFSETDLVFSVSQDGNYSNVYVGLPGKLDTVQLNEDGNSSLACINAMAKDRQITLGIKVDPAVWERPEFNSQQQNPLFAGLANSVKGIREFGFSVSFREASMGLEICVNCKDTQSALGLWTVAQGGLGMAQLAMAQEGGQAPLILSRIKTQAAEKNVFVRVDILEEDLNEFERMSLLPQQNKSAGANGTIAESDPLVGKKAPSLGTKLLDGTPFDLAEYEGKVVVLDFWATWCGPCVRALPELIENMSGFSNEEAVLVAVNQGEGKKVITQFLKNKKLTDLSVAMDKNQKIGKDYQVQGIPKTVVIDQEGVIRHVHVGFSSGMGKRLKAEIKALLEE
jgi:thiol-disulfide isomerase/thioredoxin